MYNEKVMEHFYNPKNVGELKDPDGIGRVGNPTCGDIMQIAIKVKDDVIEDVKFQTFGCGAAIATSSMVTEMVKGKTLDEAQEISNRAVADALGGLPPNKMHCSNLAADALHEAIKDYRAKYGGTDRNAATQAQVQAAGETAASTAAASDKPMSGEGKDKH